MKNLLQKWRIINYAYKQNHSLYSHQIFFHLLQSRTFTRWNTVVLFDFRHNPLCRAETFSGHHLNIADISERISVSCYCLHWWCILKIGAKVRQIFQSCKIPREKIKITSFFADFRVARTRACYTWNTRAIAIRARKTHTKTRTRIIRMRAKGV